MGLPAAPAALPSVIARFGAFELDLRAGELRKDGRTVRLQEQLFQVLKMLLEHPGEVVTREEIRKKALAERHGGGVQPQYKRHHPEAATDAGR